MYDGINPHVLIAKAGHATLTIRYPETLLLPLVLTTTGGHT